MYPNALQWAALPLRQMDNATLLSFMHNVDEKGQADNAAPMRTKLAEFWTSFHQAYNTYDQVFNPARKSLDTEDLANLDTTRDDALGAYHEALLGLQRNPNEAKRQAARQLNLNFDTYKPERSQEYMKETELIEQMTTEIRAQQQLAAAIQLLGLDDYLTDLEQKNQAFADLMKGRTASTEGYQKGAVAEARAALEQKYQLLRQMLNVASIYEGDAEYRPFLLAVNAEVEHFNQILNRKGKGSSTSTGTGPGTGDSGTGDSGSGDSGDSGNSGTDTPGTDTPGTDTPGTDTPGTDTPGTGGGGNSDDEPGDQ